MDANEARKILLLRQAELIRQHTVNADARDTVELQQDSVGRLSRMDAMQQQAMAQAAGRRRSAELSRIAAALRRIDEGEWGYCLSCGADIAPKRLAHDPSIGNCIKCASGE